MKNQVVSILLGLLASTAFATDVTDVYQLPAKQNKLYVAEVKLLDIKTPKPHCPPGAMCEIVSFADVEVTLAGCIDNLGPVTTKILESRNSTKLTLFVSALGVVNPKSANVRCIRAKTEVVSVRLRMGYVDKKSVTVVGAEAGILVNAE